jgi:hypothetical protein
MLLDTKQIKKAQGDLCSSRFFSSNTLSTIEDLRTFMEHHVWCVWDFMSLAKYLQSKIAPSSYPWFPTTATRTLATRAINEIILGEESDLGTDGNSYCSHFDLYLMAMYEIGADTSAIEAFVNKQELDYSVIPEPSRSFVQSTFETISAGSHQVAASFAYAREDLIPAMFRSLLGQLDANKTLYPKMWYYLDRHVTLDGEEHFAMAQSIVEHFCTTPRQCHEAEQAALQSIKARHIFVDAVFNKIFWS